MRTAVRLAAGLVVTAGVVGVGLGWRLRAQLPPAPVPAVSLPQLATPDARAAAGSLELAVCDPARDAIAMPFAASDAGPWARQVLAATPEPLQLAALAPIDLPGPLARPASAAVPETPLPWLLVAAASALAVAGGSARAPRAGATQRGSSTGMGSQPPGRTRRT